MNISTHWHPTAWLADTTTLLILGHFLKKYYADLFILWVNKQRTQGKKVRKEKVGIKKNLGQSIKKVWMKKWKQNINTVAKIQTNWRTGRGEGYCQDFGQWGPVCVWILQRPFDTCTHTYMHKHILRAWPLLKGCAVYHRAQGHVWIQAKPYSLSVSVLCVSVCVEFVSVCGESVKQSEMRNFWLRVRFLNTNTDTYSKVSDVCMVWNRKAVFFVTWCVSHDWRCVKANLCHPSSMNLLFYSSLYPFIWGTDSVCRSNILNEKACVSRQKHATLIWL